MNVIATLQSIDFKVAATAKSCGKVKVSHTAVKSFDRRGVSCKNARTVQFSGGVGVSICLVQREHENENIF